jgi:hypothetical protein
MRARRNWFWRRVLEYDSSCRRLWIIGQRCHHGATGSIVATTACAGLLGGKVRTSSLPRPLVALMLAGGALMAHDWKDRSVWFERGRGSQRS